MIRRSGLILLIILNHFFSSFAFAEYRAYELGIYQGRELLKHFFSNLDPDQYRGYNHVSEGHDVRILRTWMCRGDTSDFQPVCAPPESLVPKDPGPSESLNSRSSNPTKK